MNQPITIRVSMPPAELSAHNKGHWAHKRAVVKKRREAAYADAMVACNGSPPRWSRAVLHILCRYPDKRKRDLLNTAQMLKPTIDGLVDAGILKDDSWQRMGIGSISACVDRDNPGVELTIEPIDQESHQ